VGRDELVAGVLRLDRETRTVAALVQFGKDLPQRVHRHLQGYARRGSVWIGPQDLDQRVAGGRMAAVRDQVLEQRASLARSPLVDPRLAELHAELSQATHPRPCSRRD